MVCSHQRAPQYYIETMRYRNCSYWGRSWLPYSSPIPAESCQPAHCSEMGLHSILFPARGDFYVDTNAEKPYCSKFPNYKTFSRASSHRYNFFFFIFFLFLEWRPEIEIPMKNYLADRYLRQIFMNVNGRPILAPPWRGTGVKKRKKLWIRFFIF